MKTGGLQVVFFFPFQVVFEGIRGPGYEGDIAIDDVSITIGKCKQDNTVASAGKTGKILSGGCRDNRETSPEDVPAELE